MDVELKNIIKRLSELPDLIAEKERKILAVKNEIIDGEYWLTKRLVFIKSEVATEKDTENKLKYRNEIIRENEVLNRVSLDEEYKNLKKEIDRFKTDKDVLDIEYRSLINEFRAVKSTVTVFEIAKKV